MKKNLFANLTAFFENLALKPRLGGFQINDSNLRYLQINKDDKPQTFSVKLPPGIVLGGKVQDEEAFVSYLRELHSLIFPENPDEKIKTVVCLPSAVVYTQSYSIPNVGKERLKEAANLNLETISPIPAEKAYMSWQLIKETRDKFDLLGAFAESEVVDKFRDLLEKAGFSPIIFEFPSLSLSWVINNEFGPRENSFLILNISGDGIDLFLLRDGSIYFDYFRSWRSVQGNKKEIVKEDFNRVVVEEIKKVSNFASNKFNEDLKYIFVIAPGLEQEMKSLIEANFRVQAAPLQISIQPLDSSWYTVLGSAVRGNWNRSKDHYISLGTFRVDDIFFREQVIDFIKMWRNVFLGVAAVFLIITIGSYILLNTQPRTLGERLEIFDTTLEREEVNSLRESVEEFNFLVDTVLKVKKNEGEIPNILEEVMGLTKEDDLIIDSINIGSTNSPISLSGKVPSYDKVIEFKNTLENDPRFTEVNMPFSKIFTSEGNFVSFDVSFRYTGKGAVKE
jgi:Tfp pilus assembly PilM family ATPase